MVRRVLGILLILLGTASIVLGVLSATSWRTSDTVTATSSPAEVPLVLIEPGVAGIVDPVVDITITPAEPTQTVTLITARDADAEGWIADAAVQRIENLADWTELVTSTTEGVQEIPDPTVSDMWIKVEQVEGTLELDSYRAPEDRTVLLIARDGASGPAPTVSFTWQRDVATPYLMPLVGAGIAAVVLGIGLVVSSFVGRTPRREDEAEQVEPSEGQELEPLAAGTASTAGTAGDEDRDTVILGRSESDEDEQAQQDGEQAGTEAAEGEAAPGGAAPGEGMTPLTRRQLRALRAKRQEADLEVIAAGIAPASDDLASPDAPESYPGWLRSNEGEETGETRVVVVPGGDAWRRRWGVGPETNEDGTDDAGNDDAESSPTATNRGGEER